MIHTNKLKKNIYDQKITKMLYNKRNIDIYMFICVKDTKENNDLKSFAGFDLWRLYKICYITV